MDKNTILDYVTETPGNTNRAVLDGMLNSINSNLKPLIINIDNETKTLNKTWQEIYDAFLNQGAIIRIIDGNTKADISVVSIYIIDEQTPLATFGLTSFYMSETLSFSTDSTNGYPSLN